MTVTAADVAKVLVEAGFARPLPVDERRCMPSTIELAAIPRGWGRFYVTPALDVLVGYTRRRAKAIDARLRAHLLGR